LTTLAHNPSQI